MNSRRDAERLADMVDAISAIKGDLARGDLSHGLIFDAVRVRLIEIGEAVKLLDSNLVAAWLIGKAFRIGNEARIQ